MKSFYMGSLLVLAAHDTLPTPKGGKKVIDNGHNDGGSAVPEVTP